MLSVIAFIAGRAMGATSYAPLLFQGNIYYLAYHAWFSSFLFVLVQLLTILYEGFLCHNDKNCCFRTYRIKVASTEFIPWPIEIRFCEPKTSTNQTKSPPRLAWYSANLCLYLYWSFMPGLVVEIWKEKGERIGVPFQIHQTFALLSL